MRTAALHQNVVITSAEAPEANTSPLSIWRRAAIYEPIGGGIAPKILPALVDGRFLGAFRAKAPFEDLLTRMPVHVILNSEAGLLGAAVFAASSL